jgi:ribosomal-protein-alanine N-acetyltransferase
VSVEKLARDSASRARALEQQHGIEAFVRDALHEPQFDLSTEIERPFARVFIAWGPAGDASGLLVATHAADELHIYSVAVSPSSRKLGIGRALATAALEDARASALRVALLEVRRSNIAAIRLYRSVGFVAVRVRRRYYDEPVEDAVEMAREIEAGALAAFGPPVELEDD